MGKERSLETWDCEDSDSLLHTVQPFLQVPSVMVMRNIDFQPREVTDV